MSDVKIKLSADASQVREELRLIDREMRELGGSTSSNPQQERRTENTNNSESTRQRQRRRSDSSEESQEKATKDLTKEITLLRKELQKLNEGGLGTGGTTPGTPTSTPSTDGSGTDSPGSNSDNSEQENNGKNNKLLNALGKLATAAISLKAISSAFSYISSGANASMTGESKAYQTYGSTLAYSDYYDAKKDAKNLGSPYGYTYDEVMNASNTNMSLAGFTSIENYKNDMDALLGTSKAWGINSSSLASASGYMSSIGVTESGSQRKFADMLSESIVQAAMTGREDEQLQVLETISENLARTLVKVDENSLSNAVGLYTSLANGNSTLKGSRGASIVESVNDSIVNGGSTLDVLLGWGTEYTGVEGRVALQKLKEQGLTNPETLAKIFNNFEKYTGKSIDSSYGQMFLSNQLGLSYSQVEALLGSKKEIMAGKFDSSILEGDGSETKDRLKNYEDADVSSQEKYKVEKQDTKETVGEGLNNILEPFRNWYSNLGDVGKIITDGAIGAGTFAASGAALKGLKKGASALLNRGGSGGTGTGAGSSTVAGAGAGAGSAAAEVADDVVANTADDAAVSAAGRTLSSGAKGLLGKVLGPAIQVGIGAYNFSKAKNDTERSSAVGGSGGGILGGLLGSSLGPLGGIAGSWAGAELGKSVGEDLQEGKDNYGTRLAGLPFIGGLFKKKGTLIQQEQKKEQDKLKSKSSVGKPSDYGLPKDFDKAASYYTYDGVVKADIRSNVLKNDFGYSQKELDKWFSSKEFFNWMDAQGKVLNKEKEDNSSTKKANKSVDTNTTAIEKNTEAIKKLYEDKGLVYGAPYSNSYVKSKLGTSSSSSEDTAEGGLLGSVFSKIKGFFNFGSHATGNDYVPRDNYLAALHKGEMVLTKFEADEYRRGLSKGKSGTLDLNININGSVDGVDSSNQARIVDAVIQQINSSGLQNMLSTGFTRVQNY